MLEKRTTVDRPLVILSTVHWSFLWQRHQILAQYFARAGHRVIFVEGLTFSSDYRNPLFYRRAIKKFWRRLQYISEKKCAADLPKNLVVYQALVAPPDARAFREVNKQFFVPRILNDMAKMGIRNPLVWSFQPTDTALQIARELRSSALVYDCVANFAQMPGAPKNISQMEGDWLDAADLVLVDSVYLREKHAKRRPDVLQVPPGVDYDLFNQAYSATNSGTEIRRICFFGGMVSHWFDFDLMEGLADAGFEISLIGYTDSRHHLFSHPNVRYTPVVSQQKLPELLKSTDALLIPYKVNEFTRGVFPTKAYECLATGKPVVATPLPDLQDRFSGHIYLASDTTEFTKVLRQLPRLENRKKVKSRLELARKNTWEIRLRSIYREVEQLLHA